MLINLFPSTAYLDKTGKFIADPLNQPSCYQDTKVRDCGQLVHPGGRPGYCQKHTRLGCESEECQHG